MKKLLAVLLFIMMFGLYSCEEWGDSGEEQVRNQTKKIMKEINAELGLPAIKNFSEKRFLKMVLELRDQPNLINYAYLFAENSGQLIFIGKCIGYGIPYATQYTNPSKLAADHGQATALPQADPNGLYSPASAEGTWLMLINPVTGKPEATYIEPKIIVSRFPLK